MERNSNDGSIHDHDGVEAAKIAIFNPKMASVAREDNLKSYDQELSLRAPLPHFLAQLDHRQTPFYVI